MSAKLRTAIVGVGVIAAGIVPIGSAQAAACTTASVTPSEVVIGLSDVTPTFTHAVKDEACAPAGWRLTWPAAGITEAQNTAETADVTAKIDASDLTNADAGASAAVAGLINAEDEESEDDITLSLKRRTTFGSTFNAGPEPYRPGTVLTLKATLGRANWDTESYRAYTGRSVRVQVRPAGETEWETVFNVKSDSKGRVVAQLTSKNPAPSAWRFQYAGNSVSGGATSHADFVDVVDALANQTIN